MMINYYDKYLKYKKKYINLKNFIENETSSGGTNDLKLLSMEQLDDLYSNKYKFYQLYQKHPLNIKSLMNYIYANFGPFVAETNMQDILLNKIPDSKIYQLLRKNYTRDMNEINEFRKKRYQTKQIVQKIKSINETIQANLKPFKCEKILDIGTEDIAYLLELEKMIHCNTTGLNISSGYSHYVTYDEAVKSGKIVLYDGINIPFKNNEFDLTIIISVVHHVKDIDYFIKEVCRVSKNVYIRDNDMSNIVSKNVVDIQHELYEGVLYPGERSPLYYVTNEQISQLFRKNNFKIVYNSVKKFFSRPYTILASKY